MKGFFSFRKINEYFSLVNNMLLELPVPLNISVLWNFGILLGVMLMLQIMTGLLLSMHYSNGALMAFDSVCLIHRDVNSGWFLRSMHSNGASFFFIAAYIHMGRGLYYGSYVLKKVWLIGVTIYILLMATAFMGYVLPFGQMSFWGATVITNLISAVPYIGVMVVYWVWGDFCVGSATVMRFFVFHFLLPFLVLLMVIIHVLYLHQTGSSNPLGLKSGGMKVRFYIYFVLKDLFGAFFFLFFMLLVVLKYPMVLGDCDNFSPADPMSTPTHIKPEWYFLWAYAILRSVPSKAGGVVLLALAILTFYQFVVLKFYYQGVKFYSWVCQFMYWLFIVNFILLTWIGMRPVEDPYYFLGQVFSICFFLLLALYFVSMSVWDYMMEE